MQQTHSFGGGAVFVTADNIEYLDAQSWALRRQEEFTRRGPPATPDAAEPIGQQIVGQETGDPPQGMAANEIHPYDFVVRWVRMLRHEEGGRGLASHPDLYKEGDVKEPVFAAGDVASRGR